MSLISLSAYGTRVGVVYDEDSPGATEEQILAFLDDASALVNLIAFGTTEDDYWTDYDASSPPATNDVPEAVVPVIVAMVRRGIENPRGLTGEQLGDYQWQAASATQTAIYATREERRIIRRAAGRLSVGTVQLEGDLATSGLGIIADDLDELPLP